MTQARINAFMIKWDKFRYHLIQTAQINKDEKMKALGLEILKIPDNIKLHCAKVFIEMAKLYHAQVWLKWRIVYRNPKTAFLKIHEMQQNLDDCQDYIQRVMQSSERR